MEKFFHKVSTSILLVSKNVFTSILLVSSLVLNAQDFAKGTLIVKFAPEVKVSAEKGYITTGIESIDRLTEKYSVKSADKLFQNYKPAKANREVIIQGKTVKVPTLTNIYKLTLNENTDILKAVKEYSKMPGVLYAEPDYIAHSCTTPNDSYFGEQWGLNKIQAEAAWDTTTGDSSVIIGFIDTGIDTAHPDIVNNLWINKDETPDNSIDDDGNGFVDDVYGWNFVDNNNNPNDGAGHGTHCAGTAGAVTNNAAGVAGVSWKSKLMAVKVLNNNGSGTYSDIEEGIVYAAQNGAKIINMSLGGYFYSPTWEAALTNAYITSVLVGAAGNDAKSDSFYPAALPMVLAVSATDSLDKKWDGSNYGFWVDLSAPGYNIYNTTKLNGYARFTGTSCSAPFVSGVAALVATYNPTFSPGAIMNMITANTDFIDSLNPTYAGKLGTGRLNAYLALTGSTNPKLVVFNDTIKDPTGDNDGVPDISETANLILILQNNGMDVNGVSAILHADDIDITISDSTAVFGNLLARENKSNSADVFTFSVSDSCPQHNVLFKLYLSAGAYTDTVEFSIATSNTRDETGVISTNTIWKKGTHIVKGNVKVNSGITLTIEPGTEIKLDSAKTIMIDGTLNAIGTETDSIIFTKNSPDTTKRWGTLNFKSGAKSNLQYCRIEWAGKSGIDSDDGDTLYVANSTISNNLSSGWGGGISNSGVMTITNSTVSNNYASDYGGGICNDGNANYGGSLIVTNSKISDNSGNMGGIVNINQGSLIVTNSMISHNHGGGVSTSWGTEITISNNLFLNNFSSQNGSSINAFQASVNSTIIRNNTIVDTTSFCAIYGIDSLRFNNLLATHCAIRNMNVNNIPAGSNYWGTTKTAKIDSLIYDFNEDFNLGTVNYTPFLTSPSRSAPPYLDSIRVNPNPVGIETLKVYLTFSKPMNINVAPKVLFAIDAPVFDTLNTHSFDGLWADSMHWNGYYVVDAMVMDTTYRIKVSDARDDSFPFPILTDTRGIFRVYTAGSVSRELITANVPAGIKLSWHHSSVINLLGYNIYRDTLSGGPYKLVNSTVITDTAYTDTTTPHGKTSYYVYTILDNNFKESSYSSEASATVGVEELSVPKVFALSNPNPNPFTNHSTLMYQLPVKSNVSLRLFDLTGRCIKTLVDEIKIPGYYKVDLKSKDYPAGIYFAKFAAGSYKETKKLVLMK
ncbi:MAG: S8 family serine peptidase [bacterium]